MKESALVKLSTLLLAVVIMAATVLMPSSGFAQGRGHGQVKKLGKFVNGHDARDGRWDGRGPKPKWIIGKQKYRGHARRHHWWRRHGHK